MLVPAEAAAPSSELLHEEHTPALPPGARHGLWPGVSVAGTWSIILFRRAAGQLSGGTGGSTSELSEEISIGGGCAAHAASANARELTGDGGCACGLRCNTGEGARAPRH